MKKIVVFITLAGALYSLHSMENKGDEFDNSKTLPPINVVIRREENVSLNVEKLNGMNLGYFVLSDKYKTSVTVHSISSTIDGLYDITDLIQAEHKLVNEECSQLVINARNDGRAEGINYAQKIPFVIGGCQTYPNLKELLRSNNISYSFPRAETCHFYLKPTDILGQNGYDLSFLFDDIWEQAFRRGQGSRQTSLRCFITPSSKNLTIEKIEQIMNKLQNRFKKDNSSSDVFLFDMELDQYRRSNLSQIARAFYKVGHSDGYEASQKFVHHVPQGYSTKQILGAFGLGAGCIGLLWWLKSRK